MVQTFLLCSPMDNNYQGYRHSASLLDFKRLNKQITEALQILNLVESFHILGKMYNDEVPKNSYKCYEWIRKIMKQYKSLDSYLFLHQGKYVWYSKQNKKPKKLKYDEKYEIKDGFILYKGKKYPPYTLILPQENLFTFGFWSHPVVVMWLNHIDSLKLYINCHLDEFLFRGGKPGSEARRCKINTSIENISHPVWTLDVEFHKNHKAALLTKEIVRKEKTWYILKRDFEIAYNYFLENPPTVKVKTTSSFEYYMWPFTQDRQTPRYNLEKCNI